MNTTEEVHQDEKIKFRTPYDGKRFRVTADHIDPATGEHDEGPTIQSAKDECDINNIIRKYDKKQLIIDSQNAIKNYGDFSEINEFQEAQNIVIKAKESFAQIPSRIRGQFNNDPGEFFEFATNPENHEKLVELGLAKKTVIPTPQPQKVEVVNLTEKEVTDVTGQ